MKTTGAIKASFLIGGMLFARVLVAQELFVMTEPASNMPSRSLSAKASARFLRDEQGSSRQRFNPEIMFGLSKNWMLHGAISFSNMYSQRQRLESEKLYAKYRFLSSDDVHRHFRMAAFAEAAHSINEPRYDELSLDGDQSGVQAGVIATQLLSRLAISSTVGYLHATNEGSKVRSDDFAYQALNYSLSAGYLLLPVRYTSFKQTNLNFYAELLGQQTLDKSKYFIDLAPSLQLIFNSNLKLNLGYRFQLSGDVRRMADRGFIIAVERTFLNAL